MLAALTPMLVAGGFPADKYELAAKFTGALVSGDLRTASKMMTPDAKIGEWMEGHKSLSDLALYLRRCPLKSFEGNKEMNINVSLDCSDNNHSVSIEFVGNKISQVQYGPPSVIRTIASPPVKKNG